MSPQQTAQRNPPPSHPTQPVGATLAQTAAQSLERDGKGGVTTGFVSGFSSGVMQHHQQLMQAAYQRDAKIAELEAIEKRFGIQLGEVTPAQAMIIASTQGVANSGMRIVDSTRPQQRWSPEAYPAVPVVTPEIAAEQQMQYEQQYEPEQGYVEGQDYAAEQTYGMEQGYEPGYQPDVEQNYGVEQGYDQGYQPGVEAEAMPPVVDVDPDYQPSFSSEWTPSEFTPQESIAPEFEFDGDDVEATVEPDPAPGMPDVVSELEDFMRMSAPGAPAVTPDHGLSL